MYKSLTGKKLLILGATKTEIEIVNAAKELGVYTITTDNHENWHDAPAKYVSDEAWNISWSDIATLKNKCIENHIDGVMAGFSEKRVFQANILSEALGKPFYANGADLDTILDKVKFKQACIDSGVTVPKRFFLNDNIKYPVIVKPADNGGSRGITICYTDEDLKIAYEKAMSFSDNKSVIIEEYIVADDIMVFFNVHNGYAELSAVCDRIMCRFDEKITQLPVGYMYPSKYLSVFQTYNLDKFRKLITNLGIKNGLIAFQSFVRGHDVIPFDPTYRLDGTTSYHITENCTGINSLKMLINYSLVGKMGDDDFIKAHETPKFNKHYFQFPILLKKGTIRVIEGLEQIKKFEEVIFVRQIHCIGDELTKIADFSQMLCRIHLIADDFENTKKIIKKIFETIKVFDENDDDMILYRFETEKLLTCYYRTQT